LLVGDNDFLFLHHRCGMIKQYCAAEIMLLDHPIVTLPLFLLQPEEKPISPVRDFVKTIFI
jgi:hypothetical protein